MEWLCTLLSKLRPRVRFRLNAEFDASFGESSRFPPAPQPRGLEHAMDELVERDGPTKQPTMLGRSSPEFLKTSE